MILKSFFGETVESALRLARQELGSEAMFIQSNKTTSEYQSQGDYEAVFAVPDPEPPAVAAGTPSLSAPPEPVNQSGSLADEVAQLHKQMDLMADVITGFDRFILAGLTASEVAPELALAVTRSMGARIAADPIANAVKVVAEIRQEEGICPPPARPAPGLDRMKQALLQELGSRFSVAPVLGRPGPGPRTVALIGPPGAGKTTTLVKLAITYGLLERKTTQLLSVDTYRLAAVDQLRTFAAILGIGLHVFESAAGLAAGLEECAQKDLILIDTPGFSAKDLESGSELADFFASHPEIDLHLVIPCTMKPADMARLVDQFEIFGPAKLLFTKLDETEFYGSILNEAIRKQYPVSFLAAGQQIPEDLEAPTKERIIDLVLKGY